MLLTYVKYKCILIMQKYLHEKHGKEEIKWPTIKGVIKISSGISNSYLAIKIILRQVYTMEKALKY